MVTWVCNNCSGLANTKAEGLFWCPACWREHREAASDHSATLADVEIFLKRLGGLAA